MSALTDYTTYTEIRSTLGVSDKDISDATLGLRVYLTMLEGTLDELDPAAGSDIRAQYLTVHAIPEGSRTTAQQKFHDYVQAFSSCSVAGDLLVSLPYFAVKRVTDGRAEGERFSDAYASVRESVPAMLSVLRKRVLGAYAGIGGTVSATVPRTYFTATGLAVNPITG